MFDHAHGPTGNLVDTESYYSKDGCIRERLFVSRDLQNSRNDKAGLEVFLGANVLRDRGIG
jgi:hypothetical protein